VTRTRINLPNVEAQLVKTHVHPESYGHIRIRSFANGKVCAEVKQHIIKLERRGAQGLIIDVRGNVGGYMDQAQCIAGLLLGKKIVAHVHLLETGQFRPVYATQSKVTDLPVVILINGLSASASEFLPGALRDHHRAWIMGERSFGKASVQTVTGFDHPNPEKASIFVYKTTARFHQPSGSSNQLFGIEPQFHTPRMPGAEEADVAREDLLSPNTPQAINKKWRETRAQQVKVLRQCLDSQLYAEALFLDYRTYAYPYSDYQLLKAVDLLSCIE
jgi:C-terminal peptidase prc